MTPAQKKMISDLIQYFNGELLKAFKSAENLAFIVLSSVRCLIEKFLCQAKTELSSICKEVNRSFFSDLQRGRTILSTHS